MWNAQSMSYPEEWSSEMGGVETFLGNSRLQDLVIEPTTPRQAPLTPYQSQNYGPASGNGHGLRGRDGDGGGGRQSVGGGGQDRSLGDLRLSGAVVNLLLDRIRFLEQRGAPAGTSRIHQRPISLPTPVREVDGSILTTSVYRWLNQVAKAVDELGLTRSYVLYQLANEAKIPAQWRELFSGASDLESAFLHLRQRIPPLASCFPELVGKLTGQPATDGSNERVVERCGLLLSAISDMVALFPQREINREQLLAALASVGSTGQLQAQMVTTIKRFDQIYSLPPDDPSRLSYLEQLRRWLEEQRSVRVDIIASIKVGKMAEESVSTVTSFVTVPGKGKSQLPRRGKIARQEPEQVQQESIEEGQLLAEAEIGQSNAELGEDVGGVLGGEDDSSDDGTNDDDGESDVGDDVESDVNGDGGESDVDEDDESDVDDADDSDVSNDDDSDVYEGRETGGNLMRTCVICGQCPSHAPFQCPSIEEIRLQARLCPPCICKRCCNYISRNRPHGPNCSIKLLGEDRQIDYLCPKHQREHYLLCQECGSENRTIVRPRVEWRY